MNFNELSYKCACATSSVYQTDSVYSPLYCNQQGSRVLFPKFNWLCCKFSFHTLVRNHRLLTRYKKHPKSTGSTSFLLLVLIVYYIVKQMQHYETLCITFFSQRFSLFFLFTKTAHTQQRSNQQEETLRSSAPLFSQDMYLINNEHTTLLNKFSYSNVVSESAH